MKNATRNCSEVFFIIVVFVFVVICFLPSLLLFKVRYMEHAEKNSWYEGNCSDFIFKFVWNVLLTLVLNYSLFFFSFSNYLPKTLYHWAITTSLQPLLSCWVSKREEEGRNRDSLRRILNKTIDFTMEHN